MSDTLAFSLLAVAFVGLFAWGMKTGDMPVKYGSATRATNPKLFWMAAIFNALAALVCAAVAIHAGLSKA